MTSWLQNPVFLRHFHAVMTLFWLATIPVTLLTPLKASVPLLVFMSAWALVGSHWSAWQASRVETDSVLSDEDIERIKKALEG